MSDDDLGDELDDLFREPPEGFVAARTALVRKLKADGRAEDAERIKRWRRPTRAVWALNLLALTGGQAIPQLVAASNHVAELQASGSPGLRDAIGEVRRATHDTTDAAVKAMPSGRPSDREELTAALPAIIGEPTALELLARGRLQEVPEAGLGAFGLAAASAPASTARPRAATDRARRGTGQAREEAELRRRAIAEAKTALEHAEQAERRARAEGEAAAAAVQRATERLDGARKELAEAEAEAASAASSADAIGTKEEAAAEALNEASAVLAELVDGAEA